MRRLTAIVSTLALLLAACGGAASGAGKPTTLAPAATTEVPGTTASPATTSTSVAATSTTTPPVTTTAAALAPAVTTMAPPITTNPPAQQAPLDLAVYLYIDEAGHDGRTGPFLVPVHRQVPYTTATATAAIEALLAAPNTDEASSVPSLSTQIPAGTTLRNVTIVDGLATVDLSDEFGADHATAAALRFAQVVFTATRFPTVAAVLFEVEGYPTAVQTGDGDLVTRPVTRDDYNAIQAAVSVETPTYGGPAGNPLRVSGVGAAFEATFAYALTDNEGLIIAEGFAMTTNGMGWGAFDFTIDYLVDTAQLGHLIVWINSAEDGSRIDVREYPVYLVP
ncbi:MAG: GerMN domain-containing protein [Acidimicrobiia bacterium]|nr:GerMN domain-containing protein [Acidimicrobiia bacterium]